MNNYSKETSMCIIITMYCDCCVSSILLQRVANLCHDIKPGDLTHEDIRVSFNEYFVTFDRRTKVFVRYHGVLQQLPCAALQVFSSGIMG